MQFFFLAHKIQWHKKRCPGLQCKVCFQTFSSTRWTKRHKCPDHSLALWRNLTDQIKILKHSLTHVELKTLRSELGCRRARQKAAKAIRELRLLKWHLKLDKQVCNIFLQFSIFCKKRQNARTDTANTMLCCIYYITPIYVLNELQTHFPLKYKNTYFCT